jgi:Zn-dependent protease
MLILRLAEFSDNPTALIAYASAFIVALVTGIAFHEFSHAWAANKLGDDTAALQGRLTLNPLVHLDKFGTLALLLLGIGWGKPTPVNPYRLRYGIKTGNLLVSIAGPLSNFLFAVVAALPLLFGWVNITNFQRFGFDHLSNANGAELVGFFLIFIIQLNVILGIFNLIPIHPLDGFKVLLGILPNKLSGPLSRLSKWGPAILMLFIAITFIKPEYSPIRWILDDLAGYFLNLLLP